LKLNEIGQDQVSNNNNNNNEFDFSDDDHHNAGIGKE